MKILFINSVVDFGSTGKIVRDLAEGLKQNGHDVKLAFGRMEPKSTEDTVDLRDKFGTYWHVLMTRLFGRHGMHSKRATRKLIRFIDSYQPDVIHMHNLHGYYLNVPMLLDYLKDSKARLLITLHDCWTFSGNSAYFDYNGCKVWDDGCVECVSTRDYPEVFGRVNQRRNFEWKKRAFTRLPNLTVITPSDWLTTMVKDTFLSKFEAMTIHNGIDLEAFTPKSDVSLPQIEEKDRVYLGVSNIWEPRKGGTFFESMASQLREDEKIVMIGLNDAEMERLPQGIIGLKRTASMDELAAYYSRADVFVNPSLEDNFPTTNLEALACGTPVVVFDTGGCKEAIDAVTGKVAPEKNAEVLLRTIRDTVDDTNITSNLCRARAERMFSKNTMIQGYIEEIQR